MAKINTTNYQPVSDWNGTQDLLIVEQPDGTKVATPEQVKQYVEAGDFEATGEVIDGHGNILAKKADITTVTIPAFTPSQAGWRRICKIKPVSGNTIGGVIYVGGTYSNARPLSAFVAVNTVYTKASLTLLSSNLIPTDNIVRFMRLVYANSSAYWFDVYVNNASSALGPLTLKFTGDIAVSDIQNPISITTDATAASAEISLNQKVSGIVLTDESIAQAQVIKRKYITGTTTANGNLILNDFDKSNTVVVGCQIRVVDSQGGDMIVAVPYIYSSIYDGKWGLHCTSELASGEVIANKDVVGYIYYIEMPAFN